jgi:hypothetical protein
MLGRGRGRPRSARDKDRAARRERLAAVLLRGDVARPLMLRLSDAICVRHLRCHVRCAMWTTRRCAVYLRSADLRVRCTDDVAGREAEMQHEQGGDETARAAKEHALKCRDAEFGQQGAFVVTDPSCYRRASSRSIAPHRTVRSRGASGARKRGRTSSEIRPRKKVCEPVRATASCRSEHVRCAATCSAHCRREP